MQMTLFYTVGLTIQLTVENLLLSFNALQKALINLKLELNADKTKMYAFLQS